MHVSHSHSASHYLPVQATPPVKPVRPKPEAHEDHPKVKSKPPAGVGHKLDIHA